MYTGNIDCEQSLFLSDRASERKSSARWEMGRAEVSHDSNAELLESFTLTKL